MVRRIYKKDLDGLVEAVLEDMIEKGHIPEEEDACLLNKRRKRR